ncbi:MAG: SusD/RagB family nutrient-binding outer membrane lipoprotein, partial [Chloroflexota bacterium]
PFEGLQDPRLVIWVPLRKLTNGDVITYVRRGMPYGIVNQNASSLRGYTADLYNNHNLVAAGDANVCWMDYAEVCFILSELNGWDQAWYEKGVVASIERWGGEGAAEYVATLPAANQETVLTQKYIALYMNGYEAWAEYRRTGFPKSIIQVGELTGPLVNGSSVVFEAGNDRIPLRLTYPVQEYTINKENAQGAADAMGGDTFNTKLIWE